LNKKALTLTEIIVASVILAITVTALANVFFAGKNLISYSRSRVSGGELGKVFLDPLQLDVDQSQWATNCLGSGSSACASLEVIKQLGTVLYTPRYTVSDVAGTGSELKRVEVKISWPKS
jgi:hypothetical protein